jgi:hypothetical protein
MRNINHLLCESKTGKSAVLKIEIDDRFGKKTVNFSSVKGWRKDLALKYLLFESKEWNDNVVRTYIGLEILKCTKDKHEAIKFINTMKSLNCIDLHFWSNKFLTNAKTKKAWRSFYG